MAFDLQKTREAVQFNCDVADANFAGNYTMCTYLLKMRELYRWAQSIDQSEKLQTASVSRWVSEKEDYWVSIEDEDFREIPVGDVVLEPFNVEAINQAINPCPLLKLHEVGPDVLPRKGRQCLHRRSS